MRKQKVKLINKGIMKRLNSIFVLILFLTTSYIALAQTRTLTIDEAIKIALENNSETKSAKLEIKKAQAKVREAYGYAMPTIDLSGNLMHYFEKPIIFFPDFEAMLNNATYGVLFNEGLLPNDPSKFKPMGLTEQSFFLTNSFETKLQATQILFNSAVLKGIGASQIYLNLSRQALKSTSAKTITDVKKAFYGVILTKKMLKIMRESLANAEDNLKNVQAYNKQGLVSEFDLLRASVQVENLRPTVLSLENTYKNAKNGLKILLGLKQNENIEIQGDIAYNPQNILSQQDAISKAMSSNYDLKTFKVKRDVDEEFIELDRSEYWPTIAAFASYSYNGQADDFNFNTYKTGLVGVNFSINLFNGLRTNEKVQQSTIKVLQTDEQLKQIKEGIKVQVKSKINELQRVQSLVEAQDKNVQLAQKAYEIANVKYKEGTGTQLDVQNADMALRRAKTNRLQSIYDYIIAQSELEQLTGAIDSKYFRILNKLNK